MAFDHLAQAQEALIRQIQAGYEALSFLHQVDPSEALPGGPLQAQWVLQMQTLMSAHASLSRAAEALYADLTRFDEQMRAASDGEYTSMLEVRQEARGLTTVKEAGSRGGRSVSQKLGSAHFHSIGKLGGETLKEQRGPEYYRHLGQQGGQALKEKFGAEHFRDLGKRGGASLKAQRGFAYYSTIGKLGGATPRRVTQQHHEVVRAAFEELTRVSPPVTPPELAKHTGLSLSSVHSVLKHANWWGPEQQQAARAAHEQRLREQAAVQGYPGVQGMLHHPPATRGRRLTLEEVQEVRRRLQQGDTAPTIARTLGVHKNTIYSLKGGRTLRLETKPDSTCIEEGVLSVRVVFGGDTSTAQMFISRALFLALGSPPFLSLSRQGRRHALVLEAGLAEHSFPVQSAQGPHIPRIVVERQHLQSLGLAPGSYMGARVYRQTKVRLSDYPRDQAAAMVPLSEACELLHITRQGLSLLIAAGHFRAYYDAERNQLVVLRAAVLARRDQRAATGKAKPGKPLL